MPLPDPVLETVRMKLAVTPVPVTVLLTLPSPVKVTLPFEVTADVGLKRTVTVWLSPPARLYDPPDTMLKRPLVLALPVSVPPPTFFTVKVLSSDSPTTTLPKFREPGSTSMAGFDDEEPDTVTVTSSLSGNESVKVPVLVGVQSPE